MRIDHHGIGVLFPTLLVSLTIAFAWAVILPADSHATELNFLYAGTSNPGIVYKYNSGTDWDVVSSELGYAVLCLCDHQGDLYAGTMSSGDPYGGIGKIWKYDGGTSWSLVGDNLDNQVADLAVYGGNLYAGTGYGQGRLYRYDGGTVWTRVVDVTDVGDQQPYRGFRALYDWDVTGWLHLGDLAYDIFGHYDGTSFTHDAYMSGSCIYDFAEYDQSLYACAWNGRVLRSSNGTSWVVIRDYVSFHSFELEPFQGYLYVTTGPALDRYDGSTFTTAWTEPSGYALISMTAAGARDMLIFGTGVEAGSGYSTYGAGVVHTYDGSTFQQIGSLTGTSGGVQCLGFHEEATPVRLVSFDIRSHDGAVRIIWQATMDRDHAGFHVLRAEEGTTAFVRITDEMIASARGRTGYEFVDRAGTPGVTYRYRLEAVDHSGGSQTFDLPAITVAGVLPNELVLHRNYPNPFNPTTTLTFELPEEGRAVLQVCDIDGRVVRTLIDAELARDTYSVEWDGRDANGQPVASGMYIARLQNGQRQASRKLVLIQ